MALPLHITRDVSGVSRCACSNLFWPIFSWRPAFQGSCYVTRWLPDSIPLGPLTLNVNISLLSLPIQWHRPCFEVHLCLNCTHSFFYCKAKAAHSLDFLTSGKAREWSSFVLLCYRKLFLYCLTLIVYKIVKSPAAVPIYECTTYWESALLKTQKAPDWWY